MIPAPCTILSIDPGPKTSGVVLYQVLTRRQGLVPGRVLLSCAAMPNLVILEALSMNRIFASENGPRPPKHAEAGVRLDWQLVAVERVQAQGIAGNHVMHTCEASTRFQHEADRQGYETRWVYRRDVLRHLDCLGGKGSRDSLVRARCLQLHGGTKAAAQGTKKAPGPLYGVASHSWQALGLALQAAGV